MLNDKSDSVHSKASGSVHKVKSSSNLPRGVSQVDEASTSRRRQVSAASEDGSPVYVTPVVRSVRASERDTLAAPFNRATTLLPTTDSNGAPPGGRMCFCLPAITPSSKWYQAYLSYLTIGIVYGDVGTSPLYTFSSIFTSPPSESDVMGGLSLVLWAYILIVLVKYMTFILMADDNGEGGTFAMYALLSRGLRKHIKSDLIFNRVNFAFSTLALMGVSMVLADGVLTPAITVLGAVGGLTIATPVLTTSIVVLITCLILFFFFLFQYKGTANISFLFTPVLIIWFLSLASIGIYNIARQPSVFAAFNPAYAFDYFITYGYNGWAALGGVILAVTGTEAEYADLGHFNKRAMRFSSIGLVAPSLLLCYLGQGAALIQDPTIYVNVFYLGMPSAIFYPMLVLSTLAAIIASQSMVSASFSIVAQAMRLQLVPRMTVKHTSQYQIGQIYVPEVNYFYMIASIAVVAGFQSTVALGYAYGITVSSLFVITTIFYSCIIVFNFEKHWAFALFFLLFYGLIDVSLWTANLLKFVTGGWFSIILAAVFSLIMITWRWGRMRMVKAQKALAVPYAKMFDISRDGVKLRKVSNGKDPVVTDVEAQMPVVDVVALASEPVASYTIPSSLILCYSSSSNAVPAAFEHFLHRVPARPQFLVFVTIVSVNVPFVEDHVEVSAVPKHHDVFSAVVHHGYAEPPPSGHRLAAQIVRVIGCLDPSINVDRTPDQDLITMADPTFIHGKDSVIPAEEAGRFHSMRVAAFQILLGLSRPVVVELKLPTERTLELGLHVQI